MYSRRLADRTAGTSGEPAIGQRAGDTLAKRIELTVSHNLASCGLAGIDDRGLRRVLSAISQIAKVVQKCASHPNSVPNISACDLVRPPSCKSFQPADVRSGWADATGSCQAQRYPTRPAPCRPSHHMTIVQVCGSVTMTCLQFDAVAEIKSNRTVDCLHDSVLI